MSLVSQTLAQLGDMKTLEQEIVDILAATDVALSSKQIGAGIPNPPDGETLSREIYRMKKEGKIEHCKFAMPPPGSRGNVGMYRLVDNGGAPAPKTIVEPSFPEALQALNDAAREPVPACVQQNAETETQPALTTTGDTQAAVEKYLAMPAVVEDVTLDDPETVEFCIYSSGGLDIFTEGCAITLQKPVLAKLREFLGLFRDEATQ